MRAALPLVLAVCLAGPALAEEPDPGGPAAPLDAQRLEAAAEALQLRVDRKLAAHIDSNLDRPAASPPVPPPARLAPAEGSEPESVTATTCAFVAGRVLSCRVVARPER